MHYLRVEKFFESMVARATPPEPVAEAIVRPPGLEIRRLARL